MITSSKILKFFLAVEVLIKSRMLDICSIVGSHITHMYLGGPERGISLYWEAGFGVSTFDTTNLFIFGLYYPLHFTITPYGVSIPLNFDDPFILVDCLIYSLTFPVSSSS